MRQPKVALKVLLLKAGEAAEPIRLISGDYDRWFRRSVGLQSNVRFDVHQTFQRQGLPRSARGYDAVVMTGSPLSVTQVEPWMRKAADFMIDAAERGTPVLGVCFGHQLLCRALGAKVVRNPEGREIGTIEIRVSRAGREDGLFSGLPERLVVQATHEDITVAPPPSLQVLASNDNTALQAFAYGKHLRGVQFHPELSPEGMRNLVHSRSAALEREAAQRGFPPGERTRQVLAGIGPSPYAPRILRNFFDVMVRGRRLKQRAA